MLKVFLFLGKLIEIQRNLIGTNIALYMYIRYKQQPDFTELKFTHTSFTKKLSKLLEVLNPITLNYV